MRILARGTVIASFMAIASLLAIILRPTAIPTSTHPNLESIIPLEFGRWRVDPKLIPIPPTPAQQQRLTETYDQMVNRSYVSTDGRRMMISIAYGSRQDQQLKAHRQEVCYASQGFVIQGIRHVSARVASIDIPVTQMMAVAGPREEPVTYWFTVGNRVVQSRWQRLVAQLRFGLTGTIPDGVLVRISNFSSDEHSAYESHIEFINEMLATIPPKDRARFVGEPNL